VVERSSKTISNPSQKAAAPMKTLKRVVLSMTAATAVMLAGCASPQSRIRQNPELFVQLTPEQQEMIRGGQVDLGFSAEMVRLALGEPDAYSLRRDLDGTSEIWSYVTYEHPRGHPLYRGWYHRYHRWGDPLYPYYLSTPARRERERLRVIFKHGQVTAVEQEARRR
jgi:hypothetical protein